MTTPILHDIDRMPSVNKASQDLASGLRSWRVWTHLGWNDIKRRYRRTIIGPFWNTVSLALFVGCLGTVGAILWRQELSTYLPYVAAGMAVWLMVTAMITEAGNLFIIGATYINQIRCDYSILVFTLIYRNLIVFLHNIGVYLAVVVFYQPQMITPSLIWVIPGVFLVLVNCTWIVLLLSMLCLRFRDLQQLISSLIQIMIFVTPILWMPDTLPIEARHFIVNGNPFHYLIDIVRAPLLGQVPALSTYVVTFLVAVVGWIFAYMMFRRFRKRIAYWI